MSKTFRPSTRESALLSKIESSRERSRKQAIYLLRDHIEPLANSISMKLVETNLVETKNKNSLEEQLRKCLEKLAYADDFDIDYKVSPFRNLIPNPNIISLYVTAFVIEDVINHKDTVDIFGSDEDIYFQINKQVRKALPI